MIMASEIHDDSVMILLILCDFFFNSASSKTREHPMIRFRKVR